MMRTKSPGDWQTDQSIVTMPDPARIDRQTDQSIVTMLGPAWIDHQELP